jgi:hypothetical protein
MAESLAGQGDNTQKSYSFATQAGMSSPLTQSNDRLNMAYFET